MKLGLFIKIVILLFLITLLMYLLNLYTYISIILSYKEQIIIIGIIIISAMILIDVCSELIDKYSKNRDIGEVLTLKILVKYFIYLITFLLIIAVFYKNTPSLFVSLGLIGAAITYALQRPILNLAGWMIIVFTRTIKIGDRVAIKDVGIGDVFNIDMQHIYIRELDNLLDPTGRVLIVPNSYIFDRTIVNFTKGTSYIWDRLEVHFTYDSNLKKIEEIVFSSAYDVVGKTMEEQYKKWIKNRYILTGFLKDKPIIRIKLTRSSIAVRVLYLVDTFEKASVKTEIYKRIIERVKKEEDVSLAYPHIKVVK
ncbi:hypothetical protein J422_00110 [Methanocaldococcus villosus KIN24-T80]|uniref:MscS Mechanosensitive ion channel n=1 Tax=Methanocaldococcus villosus KIN24-T80 TaxID=1069083 RepID=N6VSF2_9EURY|nr:mechanosensitive ion channel domain-containing protein [Methanocaldococcus villosus]ENN96805.1 hypothetical protein J422_00110 [Methanocaldococcus villosus KIN24-T80]